MLFNSGHFLVFFPLVVVLYYLLSHRWRWLLLLVASYYFYMSWNPAYITLIVFSTVVDYWAGWQMGKAEKKKARKPWLWLSLASNLGLLGFFKYYNFFLENVNHVSGADLQYVKFLLPVGISFYTFQTLSYSIDIYRGEIKPEKHFGRFALFVSFFPQLVAGPIERAKNLLPQIRRKVEFNVFNFTDGGKRIIWGLFKKVVIADNVAILVDHVYASPEAFGSTSLLIASYLFAFQIYCDFSGYSDIAIGAAKMMGFDLMENFRTPYFSRSIREFWSRWHISLSTWFRDYVYIPLGGSKIGRVRWQLNLFLVFAVSGLWHGAAWTFVAWGMLHGGYLMLENLFNRKPWFVAYMNSKGIAKWVGIVFVFHLVVLGWIFFRAENMDDAWAVIHGISQFDFSGFLSEGFPKGTFKSWWLIRAVIIVGFLFLDTPISKIVIGEKQLGLWPKYGLFALLLTMTVVLGNWGEVAFLYFQF